MSMSYNISADSALALTYWQIFSNRAIKKCSLKIQREIMNKYWYIHTWLIAKNTLLKPAVQETNHYWTSLLLNSIAVLPSILSVCIAESVLWGFLLVLTLDYIDYRHKICFVFLQYITKGRLRICHFSVAIRASVKIILSNEKIQRVGAGK